jgi:hypothetical protein
MAAPGLFVGHHQFGHAQAMLLAQAQQFVATGEVVRQLGVILVQLAGGRLFGIDHETATDRIIGAATQLAAVGRIGRQGHGIRVIGQVLFEQQHVALPVEGNRQTSIQLQGATAVQCFNAWRNVRRIDLIRPVTHQAHDHRGVTAMADAGGRQRAIQAHFHTLHPLELVTLAQRASEQRGGAHGADGMRAGRPDTDLEQVENTDSHN